MARFCEYKPPQLLAVCLFILIQSTPQAKCSRVKGLWKLLPFGLGYSIQLWDQPLGLIFS